MTTQMTVDNANSPNEANAVDELRKEFERREFGLLSLISSLQRELYQTRSSVEDWKSNHIVEDGQLRTVIVDPTVNIEIKELRHKLFEKDQIIMKARDDLQAQNFNPQRATGLRLINKCKTLLDENSDLGRYLSENQLQPLNILLSNQKKYTNTLMSEMKQLRELNNEIDQDNDELTNQLSDMTTNFMLIKEERDQLKQEIHNLENFIDEIRASKATEHNLPRSYELDQPTSHSKDTSTPHSPDFDSHGSVRQLKRQKSDKDKHSHSDKREKDREGRKIRDRSRERERHHKESHRERDRSSRRKDKSRADKERDRD